MIRDLERDDIKRHFYLNILAETLFSLGPEHAYFIAMVTRHFLRDSFPVLLALNVTSSWKFYFS